MSNYFNRPNPLGLAVSAVKNVFKSRGKNPTPGTAINKVPPNVPKTKLDKSKSNLNKAIQKGKATSAKLKQTQFEIKNPKFKGKDFTFATSKKKTESNKEAYKRIQGENTKAIKSMVDEAFKGKKLKNISYKLDKLEERVKKAKGGRVGLKFGGRKSNVQKIQETFGVKKKLSPKQMKIAKLAGNPKKIDAQDLAKLRGRG